MSSGNRNLSRPYQKGDQIRYSCDEDDLRRDQPGGAFFALGRKENEQHYSCDGCDEQPDMSPPSTHGTRT